MVRGSRPTFSLACHHLILNFACHIETRFVESVAIYAVNGNALFTNALNAKGPHVTNALTGRWGEHPQQKVTLCWFASTHNVRITMFAEIPTLAAPGLARTTLAIGHGADLFYKGAGTDYDHDDLCNHTL